MRQDRREFFGGEENFLLARNGIVSVLVGGTLLLVGKKTSLSVGKKAGWGKNIVLVGKTVYLGLWCNNLKR